MGRKSFPQWSYRMWAPVAVTGHVISWNTNLAGFMMWHMVPVLLPSGEAGQDMYMRPIQNVLLSLLPMFLTFPATQILTKQLWPVLKPWKISSGLFTCLPASTNLVWILQMNRFTSWHSNAATKTPAPLVFSHS